MRLSPLSCLRKDTLFLEGTDSLRTKNHRHFLTVDGKRLLLQVRLEDALGATQRKADIVAKLLAFAGEFTSCCHNYLLLPLIFTNLYHFTLLVLFRQGEVGFTGYISASSVFSRVA